MVKNRGIFDFFLPKSSASNLHYNDAKKLSMYFRLICTKIMKVKNTSMYIIMMFKKQVLETYLYQNHTTISTYILYFLEKVPQIYDIMTPKN